MALTLITSCGTNTRLLAAANTRGKGAAHVQMPDLPAECRRKVPHAFKVGDEAVTALKKERRALDRANARGARCAGFYDATKKNLEVVE